MFAIITLLLTAVFFALLVYPYVIYPMFVRLLPTKAVTRRDGYSPKCTLVFCAYNEAQVIDEKLANIEMLKDRHPEVEVLAFDDGSDDSTYEMLAARPDLLTVVRGGGRSGKAHGMKRLAAQASGDVLVFTDANVLLRESALQNLLAYYADPSVGGVCGSLVHYSEADPSATASVGSLYWRLEEAVKDEESRTGSVMGADGSIFSLRRSLYPEFPDTVLDDLTVSMAAVFAGYRLIKAQDVVAYEDIVPNRQDEFARKIRISARAFHTHRFLLPQLRRMSFIDRFKYTSRKLLRWFGGLFLVAGCLSAAVTVALVSVPLLIALLACTAFLLWRGLTSQRGRIASIFEIILALIATQIGVFQAMFGRTFSVWEPAARRLPDEGGTAAVEAVDKARRRPTPAE